MADIITVFIVLLSIIIAYYYYIQYSINQSAGFVYVCHNKVVKSIIQAWTPIGGKQWERREWKKDRGKLGKAKKKWNNEKRKKKLRRIRGARMYGTAAILLNRIRKMICHLSIMLCVAFMVRIAYHRKCDVVVDKCLIDLSSSSPSCIFKTTIPPNVPKRFNIYCIQLPNEWLSQSSQWMTECELHHWCDISYCRSNWEQLWTKPKFPKKTGCNEMALNFENIPFAFVSKHLFEQKERISGSEIADVHFQNVFR